MDVIKNLLSSAHGLVAVLLIAGATVLTGLGKMTIDQWTSYSQWIFGIFVGGHAVISAADSFSGKSNAPPAAPPAPAPAAPAATPTPAP